MPAALRDIARAIEKQGGVIQKPNGGSHWRATKNGKMYPIPAHNGPKTEISECYIRGVCRNLDLDEARLRRDL